MAIAELSTKESDLISTCYLFDSISPDLLDRMLAAKGCHVRSYAKHELVSNDDYSESVGLVLSGTVQVSTPSGSKNLIMRELKPGDIFGVATLFSKETDSITNLTANSSCKVLFIHQELLRSAMKEEFILVENCIRFLSGRVRFLNRKISGLAAGSAEEMLAMYLSDFDTHATVSSYSRLAEELSLGRASLYRALEALESNGLILRNGHTIQIINKEGLKEILK